MKHIKTIGRNTKITFDIDKLIRVKEEFAKKYVARVGVLGQKTNRIPMITGESHEQYKARVRKLSKNSSALKNQEKTNAEIGLIHELGSLSDHIPRRSFLEMPLTLKMPSYSKAFGDQIMKAIDTGNIKPAYVNLGIKGEQVVQLAFASSGYGQWDPNAESTVNKKGSSSPLIDTAQLRRSITSDVTNK